MPRESSSPDLIVAALELVRRRTGLVFSGARRPAFESGLLTAMRRMGIGDPPAYLHALVSDPAVFDELTAEITASETSFLRDAEQWELLRTRLLPPLLARRERPIRIWSAGCASGEEPYSVAILLHQLGAAGQARIVGTDISRPALAQARRAEYSDVALSDVPEQVTRTFFRRLGMRYELLPAIRREVEFRYLNLADDSPSLRHGLGEMDLVLCRNVLVDFDAETLTRVARRLLDSLGKDGCLMLGASDPQIGQLVSCEVEAAGSGLVYRRSTAASAPAFPPATAAVRADPPSVSAGLVPTYRLPETAASDTQARTAAPRSDLPVFSDSLAEVRRRYALKDYAEAADLARVLIAAGETDPTVHVLRVRALANSGDLVGAGRACAEGIDSHRTCAELIYLRGLLLSQSGNHTEAAEALRRALSLDRRLIVAHLALGGVLTRLGEADAARRAFLAAEQLLAELVPSDAVSASDGEPAGHLAEVARSQLRLLDGSAA